MLAEWLKNNLNNARHAKTHSLNLLAKCSNGYLLGATCSISRVGQII